jgi:hypothetical protein
MDWAAQNDSNSAWLRSADHCSMPARRASGYARLPSPTNHNPRSPAWGGMTDGVRVVVRVNGARTLTA